MVNIITPESLRRDTDVPSVEEMWNAIWNLYSTYQAVHGQPPKYLYLNPSGRSTSARPCSPTSRRWV
jgi:hypothetical protein